MAAQLGLLPLFLLIEKNNENRVKYKDIIPIYIT